MSIDRSVMDQLLPDEVLIEIASKTMSAYNLIVRCNMTLYRLLRKNNRMYWRMYFSELTIEKVVDKISSLKYRNLYSRNYSVYRRTGFLKQGRYTVYDYDDDMTMQCYYLDGKLHGCCSKYLYFELVSRKYYVHGKKHGISFKITPAYKIIKKYHYGELVSKILTNRYDETGSIECIVRDNILYRTFKDGYDSYIKDSKGKYTIRHGPYKNEYVETTYYNGEKHGSYNKNIYNNTVMAKYHHGIKYSCTKMFMDKSYTSEEQISPDITKYTGYRIGTNIIYKVRYFTETYQPLSAAYYYNLIGNIPSKIVKYVGNFKYEYNGSHFTYEYINGKYKLIYCKADTYKEQVLYVAGGYTNITTQYGRTNITTYKDNRLHGPYITVDSSGRVILDAIYDMGSIIKYKSYYSNDQPHKVFENNKYIKYDINGAVKSEYTIVNGRLQGDLYISKERQPYKYYINGIVSRKYNELVNQYQ